MNPIFPITRLSVRTHSVVKNIIKAFAANNGDVDPTQINTIPNGKSESEWSIPKPTKSRTKRMPDDREIIGWIRAAYRIFSPDIRLPAVYEVGPVIWIVC